MNAPPQFSVLVGTAGWSYPDWEGAVYPARCKPADKLRAVAEFLGAGRGFLVRTEEELDRALTAAERHTESFSIIEAQLDPSDYSPALRRLTERMARRVHGRSA